MKSLKELIDRNKHIRVVGFDDAPFAHKRGTPVHLSGIICSDTRFEGMLWGQVTKDGQEATQVITDMLRQSKFYDQVNLVLTDGLAVGGFSIVDLPKLAEQLQRPCIALMRKPPDMEAIKDALSRFEDGDQRLATLLRAGEIYQQPPFYYQVAGCCPHLALRVLRQITDTGHVPEALRLAHMIGAAVMTGQSSRRA